MNDDAPGIPLTIVEVPSPTFRSRVGAAEAPDGGPRLLDHLTDVENAMRRSEYGAAALQTDADETSALWALATHWRRRSVVARNGEEYVGVGTVRVPLREALADARVRLGVVPHARGRGVGGALLEVAERIAREEGRTRLRLHAPHVAGIPFDPSAGWIEAPDGAGRVPAAAASSRFLTDNGWTLAGVERVSALDLQSGADAHAAAIDAQITAALDAAAPDYALHVWTGPTPPEWLGGVAQLSARLPGDSPTGDAAAGEEAWDVNRVASNDVRIAAANRTAIVAGVEHVPSGTLVAFSELQIWRDHPRRPALQGVTIVGPEHRGHRLGLLTKAAALRELRQRAPECPGVVTWTAESDTRLIALNEQLGFRPIGVEGVWVKTIDLVEPDDPAARTTTDASTTAPAAPGAPGEPEAASLHPDSVQRGPVAAPAAPPTAAPSIPDPSIPGAPGGPETPQPGAPQPGAPEVPGAPPSAPEGPGVPPQPQPGAPEPGAPEPSTWSAPAGPSAAPTGAPGHGDWTVPAAPEAEQAPEAAEPDVPSAPGFGTPPPGAAGPTDEHGDGPASPAPDWSRPTD